MSRENIDAYVVLIIIGKCMDGFYQEYLQNNTSGCFRK